MAYGTSVFMYADKLLRFKAPVLAPSNITYLAGVAVHEITARARAGRNLLDQSAKPYSASPVYIPLTGKGRTKTNLRGREVLTASDILKIKRAGLATFHHKGKEQKAAGAVAKPDAVKAKITNSKKSVRYNNRSEYKRAKGKPGYRDLEESGRMLNSIGIVSQNPSSVHIGFRREEEHKKAKGNQRIDPWYGLSPANRAVVLAKVKEIVSSLVKDLAS